jgi:LysR family transcriptional regulator, transcriptional activator for bauABCD operon
VVNFDVPVSISRNVDVLSPKSHREKMLTKVSVPDINLLRVFSAVAEAGSFSAAQILLNVSQSTISTQMAELEARLGLRLCERGRSGFSLTDDGHAVYEATKHLFRNCSDFVTKINARRSTLSGALRIALADALVGNSDFPADKIFRTLRERMPGVNFMLSQADPLTIERYILDKRIDAGIHTFPSHAPGLRYIKLFTERQTLYCADSHPLFGRDDHSIDVVELGQYDYAAREYYGGSLKPGAFRPLRVSSQCTTMEGTVALILSGKFIGHVPSLCAKRWLESGRLRPILPEKLSYSCTFECVLPVGTSISRQLDILEEVLSSEFGT